MSGSHALQPDTDHGGLDVICALLTVFGGPADPRSPRGIRHELASVLTITVLAVLAGARNFREAGDRAAELPYDLLIAAGARNSPATDMHLYRAEGDRLAEHWGVRDELSVLWQVGALPTPPLPDLSAAPA